VIADRTFAAALAAAALAAGGCGSTGPSPVAPTIVCPAAQMQQSPDGTAVAVHYPLPAVSGGAQPISIVCTPPSGSSFSVGSATVTCTARDARQQAASCSFGVTVTAAPKLTATKFVAFGDSITAGAREACQGGTLSAEPLSWELDNRYLRARPMFIDVNAAYPTKLQAMLADRYTTQSTTVRNEGKAGECVAVASHCLADSAGETRFPMVISADAPEVMLLQEGINDINGRRRAAFADVINGLRSMIGNARGRGGITVFLGTLLPERLHACRGYAADIIPEMNDQIRALAASENIELVDLYAAFGADAPDTYIGPDGLHPTVEGYQLMAQTFFDAIRKKLEPAATTARVR
jgi:lysophospholipase L1-like esterase